MLMPPNIAAFDEKLREGETTCGHRIWYKDLGFDLDSGVQLQTSTKLDGIGSKLRKFIRNRFWKFNAKKNLLENETPNKIPSFKRCINFANKFYRTISKGRKSLSEKHAWVLSAIRENEIRPFEIAR